MYSMGNWLQSHKHTQSRIHLGLSNSSRMCKLFGKSSKSGMDLNMQHRPVQAR